MRASRGEMICNTRIFLASTAQTRYIAACPRGQGAACKAVYAGSIPAVASTTFGLRDRHPSADVPARPRSEAGCMTNTTDLAVIDPAYALLVLDEFPHLVGTISVPLD